MNLSKASNDESVASNWRVIDRFARLSHGNGDFANREIRILAPDIIIAMNFGERIDCLGGKLDQQRRVSEDATLWRYTPDPESENPKSIPLIDAWHFSAPGKSPERNIYLPLKAALAEAGC
jgi:hypothetical protein